MEKVDITREERIVTMSRGGNIRQRVEILESGDGNTGTSRGGVDHRIPPFAHRLLVNAYQFYDFRTEDRPLKTAEIAELRAISARRNHIEKLHKPLQMGGFDQLTSQNSDRDAKSSFDLVEWVMCSPIAIRDNRL